MRSILAPVLGFVLAAPAGASVSDFRLPPASAPQQAPPDLQGPVAPDVPASRQTTPVPSATRTASPTPTPAPIVVPESLRPAPATTPARRRVAAPPAAEPVAPVVAGTSVAQESDNPPAPALSPPRPTTTATGLEPRSGGSWPWPWLAAGLALLLVGLAFTGWIVRRARRQPARAPAVPQLERPRLEPSRPAQPANPAAIFVEPLQVMLEPLRLSLTLLNATLAYRLELANSSAVPLIGLTIGADMISAHASLSREVQLSGPRNGSDASAQRIDRLEPGERRVVTGEFRLPFPEIVPIRQGNAALLLPLARIRIEAQGVAPVVRTFLVGQPGANPESGLQPFRLDQGPRVYPRVAQRAFA